MNITPAILEYDFESILSKVNIVKNLFGKVQIDIVSSDFANQQTWPFNDEKIEFEKLNGLDLEFDLDLMVNDLENYLDDLIKLNANRYILHRKENIIPIIQKLKGENKIVFIAITVNDDLEKLKDVFQYVDGVQFMGIKYVGKQGQPYDENIENYIKEVKKNYNFTLSIDGAISGENIKQLKDLGIEEFAIGSALLRGDINENIKKMQI